MDCSRALGLLYVETCMLTLKSLFFHCCNIFSTCAVAKVAIFLSSQSNSPASSSKLTVFGNDGVVAENGNLNGNVGEAVDQRIAYNGCCSLVLNFWMYII